MKRSEPGPQICTCGRGYASKYDGICGYCRRRAERIKNELYDADPNCPHSLESQPGGGVKCKHCGGWFCY